MTVKKHETGRDKVVVLYWHGVQVEFFERVL